MPKSQQITNGFTISRKGEATVEPELADILFDIALELEPVTGLPVDVEHVLAALVLASRAGVVATDHQLETGDKKLITTLVPFIKAIFSNHGGKVGKED